jgi:hypothetical protein
VVDWLLQVHVHMARGLDYIVRQPVMHLTVLAGHQGAITTVQKNVIPCIQTTKCLS